MRNLGPLILNTVGCHMSIMFFLIYGSLTLDLSTKSVDILLSRLFQTPIKGLYLFVISPVSPETSLG